MGVFTPNMVSSANPVSCIVLKYAISPMVNGMVAILKIATTEISLPVLLRRLRAAGYFDVRLDLRGSYRHLTVKAWGGDLRKFKESETE